LPRKPDALIWVLGALALACVLGLIPLYWNVYRTYSEPPGNITTPTKPASTVAPQSSAATQATSIASITATPTSTAVALQEIPIGLIGRVYDDSLKDFFTKSISWTIVTTDEVNFVQPEKMILAVDPAAGSRVPTTSTITLTLSSGGRVPLSVTFATPIVLESARLNSDKLRAGQTLEVGLNWRASGRVGASYKTFVHVLRLDRDELVAQGDDREPRNNGIPATTSTWSNGTLVNDTFDIALPRDLPAGRYRVQVGLYDDRGRLQVSNSGKTSATNNSVLIRIIEVTR
jgi:hypothetical protein